MAETFRADHVGSLLRPESVHEARRAFQQGRLDADELRAVEDAAILDAIERQRAAGVSVYTDGEFRRTGFQNDLIEAVDGFVTTDTPAVVRVWQGPGGEPTEQTRPWYGSGRGRVASPPSRAHGRWWARNCGRSAALPRTSGDFYRSTRRVP